MRGLVQICRHSSQSRERTPKHRVSMVLWTHVRTNARHTQRAPHAHESSSHTLRFSVSCARMQRLTDRNIVIIIWLTDSEIDIYSIATYVIHFVWNIQVLFAVDVLVLVAGDVWRVLVTDIQATTIMFAINHKLIYYIICLQGFWTIRILRT